MPNHYPSVKNKVIVYYTASLFILAISACKKEPAKTTAPAVEATDTLAKTAAANVEENADISLWDFNGDGIADDEITIHLMEGEGNPVEDGTPDSYTVIFNNKSLPEIAIGCCTPIPVGEGDLNGDGAAELTLIQEPMNGCTYTLTIWSLSKGRWRQVFGPEMLPTACDRIVYEDLKSLIVKEADKVYFYKPDPNDEDFKKVKTEIQLL